MIETFLLCQVQGAGELMEVDGRISSLYVLNISSSWVRSELKMRITKVKREKKDLEISLNFFFL
jgi:hypothetical protein